MKFIQESYYRGRVFSSFSIFSLYPFFHSVFYFMKKSCLPPCSSFLLLTARGDNQARFRFRFRFRFRIEVLGLCQLTEPGGGGRGVYYYHTID